MPDNSHIRIFFQGFEYTAKLLLRPPIIAIQHRNNISAGLRYGKVECRGLAAVQLCEEAHARLKLADNFRRAVSRAVIDNDNLSVRHGHVLFEHTSDCLLDE